MAETATGTMQLGLVALAMVFLSSMGHSDALKLSKARRQRRGEFSPPLFPSSSALLPFVSAALSHSGCPINI